MPRLRSLESSPRRLAPSRPSCRMQPGRGGTRPIARTRRARRICAAESPGTCGRALHRVAALSIKLPPRQRDDRCRRLGRLCARLVCTCAVHLAGSAREMWPRSRAGRTAPRKTLSNAVRHASSGVVAMVPGGVPPTLISAPSRRPKRSSAAAISRAGVAASALSAATQATRPADLTS
jgi:hypothetical protein